MEKAVNPVPVPTSDQQPRLSESGWQNQIASIQVRAGTWDFFAGEEFTCEDLETTLHSYLASLQLENLVTDDCTLAVLIGEQAGRYRRVLSAHAQVAV